MEGQKAQVIIGTLLAATIIAVLKILHVFLQRKKHLQSEDKGQHRQYEKLATEEVDEDDISENSNFGESEDLVAPHRDLVFEEYMTINQECLVATFYNEVRAVAICCFRNDAIVEYFNESIPAWWELRETAARNQTEL